MIAGFHNVLICIFGIHCSFFPEVFSYLHIVLVFISKNVLSPDESNVRLQWHSSVICLAVPLKRTKHLRLQNPSNQTSMSSNRLLQHIPRDTFFFYDMFYEDLTGSGFIPMRSALHFLWSTVWNEFVIFFCLLVFLNISIQLFQYDL